jgi:hypothetical protein
MQENLERLEAELAAALLGMSAREAQLAPRANPEKWNIQQIVEHLLLTYRSTVALVQVRLDKGAPTKAKPSVAQRVGQFTLIDLGFFPPGRQAPAAVCPTLPASLRTGEELTGRLRQDVRALDEVLTRAQAVFGAEPFASHIILGPLSATQWSKFHLVHGRHHVRQIHRIRKDRSAE